MKSDKRRDLMLIENAFVTIFVLQLEKKKHAINIRTSDTLTEIYMYTYMCLELVSLLATLATLSQLLISGA